MTGIPLITAEGTVAESVAVDNAEGSGAETGCGSDHGAEGLTGQRAEAAYDDMMYAPPLQRGTPPTKRKMPRGLNMPRSQLTPPPKPLLWTLKMSFTHRLRRRPRLPAGQLAVTSTTRRTWPSLKPRCSLSAPQHVKLTPKVQAMLRLSPRRPPQLKLRSEGSRTRV
jgi:hypothetical protein